jgi:hypothetical protein
MPSQGKETGTSKGSDPNGARITQPFGSIELAANIMVSLFYASIYYLAPLDSLFCLSTGYREQMVGLRAALDGTWFIAARSVTYPLLTDQGTETGTRGRKPGRD